MTAQLHDAREHASTPTDREYRSWGHYPRVESQRIVPLTWADTVDELARADGFVLPYGYGRSYGDSCLNEGGVLLDARGLNRFLSFDEGTGVLRCEAGVTLGEILDLAVPRGWFLPTSPGTKFVSVGGAIANDVHGKNHHVAGTFGRHVQQLELLRSDGERFVCSPTEHTDMFRATIGGLGLTGLILWAEVKLRPISGPFIDMESVRFGSLDEFFEVSAESDRDFEYTMSWVDCLATGRHLGRGLFMRGNHSWQPRIPGRRALPQQKLIVPFELPSWLLNSFSIRSFNVLNYHKQLPKRIRRTIPFDPFFYPLDSIREWNRMYGPRGFVQHQCVVPPEASHQAMRLLFETISQSGEGSFLAVLKTFGSLPSPGMMSFPRPGTTLALDFPFRGERTLQLLDRLDDIVLDHGGAIYPAKDARMSTRAFEASFPQWRDFSEFVDERFSSSLWRRVTGETATGTAS